jgi:hypothetical protein
VTLVISATDAVGVVAYRASQSATTPTAVTSGWINVTPTTAYSAIVPFTLSAGNGVKTVYVWFKDAAGNVSAGRSDTIVLDTIAPTLSAVAASDITSTGATVTWITNEASNTQVDYGMTSAYGFTTRSAKLVTSHSRTLTGLQASTLYHYRVKGTDAAGNTVTGTDNTFTTKVATDTTAPLNTTPANFINAGASATNTTTATLILSATDSVGVVAYRASESSVTPTAATSGWTNVTPMTAYSAKVPFALSAGDAIKTVYVWFKDAAGNVSAVQSASIALDTAAPVISAVAVSAITASNATITWSTNEPSNSYVNFGTTTAYNEFAWNYDGLVTSHRVTAHHLQSGKTYHYRVTSTDAAGNRAIGVDNTFTTVAPSDTTAPVNTTTANFINNGAAFTKTKNVTFAISATDAVGVVAYRVSESAIAPSATSPGWTTVTSQTEVSLNVPFTLSSGDGLKSVYVWFKDIAGNVSAAKSDSIRLDTVAPTLSAVASSAITSASAKITWTTNEPSDSRVDYGTSTAYGSTAATATLVTSHSEALTTGLTASTTYHYRVMSTDAAGNTVTGTDKTFTTTAATTDNTAPANTTATDFINAGALATNSPAVTLAISATDAVGVVAYRLSESATPPTAAISGWIAVTSTTIYSANVPFTLSAGDGTKTVYVWFKDAAGHVSGVMSDSIIFDMVPPTLSGIAVSGVTAAGATISWTTNEASNTKVDFGTTTSYGSTAVTATWVTNHNQTLSGLTPLTTYHYRVSSTDVAGNTVVGLDNTFTTTAPIDSTPPANTTAANFINAGATLTNSIGVTLALTATDAIGVVAYRPSESATTPTAATPGWVTVPSIALYSATVPFALSSGDGLKTVYVWFEDAAGNVSAVMSSTITLDTTAPVLSFIASQNITASGANINWTTNELSNTQVDYGLTSAYGSTAANAALLTNHSQALTGLTASSTYHYRVKSTDAAGNTAIGGDSTFTTAALGDTTAPINTTAAIFINAAAPATHTTAVTLSISATDDVGVAAYFSSETVSIPAAAAPGWVSVVSSTNYSAGVPFTLSSGDGLKTVNVWFKDAAGNVSTGTSGTIFLDTIPPVLSAIAASAVTSTSATIGWTTDEASDTQVEYGTTTSYGFTASTAAAVMTHSQTLTGLVGSTTYHYRVKSTDAAGNTVTSTTDDTFTTTPTGDVAAPVNTTLADFINSGAIRTDTVGVALTVSASDNVGVVAYLASESLTQPTVATAGWVAVSPATTYAASVPFELSTGAGVKTVSVWFIDAAGNVSGAASDTINYDPPPDIYDEAPRDVIMATQIPRVTVLLGDKGNGIDLTKTKILVDSIDVTASASISATLISWLPATPLTEADHLVRVETASNTGVATFKEWHFKVKLPPGPDPAAKDGVRSPRTVNPSIRVTQ